MLCDIVCVQCVGGFGCCGLTLDEWELTDTPWKITACLLLVLSAFLYICSSALLCSCLSFSCSVFWSQTLVFLSSSCVFSLTLTLPAGQWLIVLSLSLSGESTGGLDRSQLRDEGPARCPESLSVLFSSLLRWKWIIVGDWVTFFRI